MGKNSLVELTTAIQNIIVSDIVYRRTHNKISDDQIVIYKYDDDPLGVKLGEIALFFRNLSEKYKTDNYAQLLLLPEATEYIENTYDKFLENVVFFIFKKEGIDPTLKSAEEIEMQKEYNKPLIRKGIEEGLQMKNQEVFGRP